jgi:predicted secreted hydrolase
MMRVTAPVMFALFCVACGPAPDRSEAPPASSAPRLDAILGGEDAGEYARALAPRQFAFPADHGPHSDFRHEWWYFTGHLDAEGGRRFGFELTFFRFALVPPARPLRGGESRWRTKQLYAAHFAITDIERQTFHSTGRFARDALGLAGASGLPLRVWLDDWSLTLPDDSRQPWTLSAHEAPYRLELELRPDLEPVLNGDAGLSRKSASGPAASYYYSIPRLTVRGTLGRDADRLKVTGSAWLDREWGSDGLAPDETGWDWFALQLDDGSSLMFYSLRRTDGTRDPASAGTYVDSSGVERALRNEDVRLSVGKQWRSPRGGVYPAEWRLQVPSLGVEVQLQPVLADQELDTTPRYWEGAVDVTGSRSGAALRGRGYVELTGYANAAVDARIRATQGK